MFQRSRFRSRMLLIGFLLLAAPTADATERHATPSNLTSVFSNAKAGDTIRVAHGTYKGQVKLEGAKKRYIQIIGDETMTTINFPKNYVYYAVLLGFVLMFVRSVQVAVQHLRQGYSILERPGAYDGFEG